MFLGQLGPILGLALVNMVFETWTDACISLHGGDSGKLVYVDSGLRSDSDMRTSIQAREQQLTMPCFRAAGTLLPAAPAEGSSAQCGTSQVYH